LSHFSAGQKSDDWRQLKRPAVLPQQEMLPKS
jgi:hypothetical protein